MSNFVNTLDILGDDALADSIIDGSITEYFDDTVSNIGEYAFHGYEFLTSVNCPMATTIGQDAIRECNNLVRASFSSATIFYKNALFGCQALAYVDLGAATSLMSSVLGLCNKLATLIIRTPSVCTLSNKLSTSGLIGKGTGYIYVPRALVDSYKSATNWSAVANQFRALEDYTVDGTITGELDANKI